MPSRWSSRWAAHAWASLPDVSAVTARCRYRAMDGELHYRRPMTAPRPLEQNERALLDGFLSLDFEGVQPLREQARVVQAAPGCTCGCGSLDLFVGGEVPPSTAKSPVPAEGVLLSDEGKDLGGLLLFLDSGRLSYLEVYSFVDPLPLPDAASVEWVVSKGG